MAGGASLHVQLLGPMTIRRDGVAVALPASRKVRALLAYLALAPHAVSRSQLCELLWDVPNDPRGELRWCLSKLRGILDEPGRRRVRCTRDDTIQLDLADCFVDAIEIARATQEGIETLPPERLRTLSALFDGEFLEGLEIDRNPAFQRLAHGPAAPLSRLPRRAAGTSRRQARPARRCSDIWRNGSSSRRSTSASTRFF